MKVVPTRTTFLPGVSIRDEIRKLVHRSSRVWVAVAYWGAGATEWLDLKARKQRDVIVVCDLMSGACNPDEIASLRRHLGERFVLKLDRLHAKTWLGDKCAIVGSANISANGLGFEATELAGLIEASMYSEDIATVEAVDHWFKSDVLPNATQISEADIRVARRRWKDRRANRPICSSSGSLLDALKRSPSDFSDRNFLVWIYDEGELSANAERELQRARKERRNQRIYAWENVEPGPPPGSIIVDFWADGSGRVKGQGLWQVLHDEPLIRMGPGKNVLLCRQVMKAFGFPLGDK